MLETAQTYGYRVFYGDATRMDLLRIAGAASARVLVIAVDSVEQSIKIASQVRKHFPNLEVVARARDLDHWFRLRDLGVKHAQREVFESSLISAQSVLELIGESAEDARRVTKRFRDHNQALAERMYPHYKDKDQNQLIAVASRAASNWRSKWPGACSHAGRRQRRDRAGFSTSRTGRNPRPQTCQRRAAVIRCAPSCSTPVKPTYGVFAVCAPR